MYISDVLFQNILINISDTLIRFGRRTRKFYYVYQVSKKYISDVHFGYILINISKCTLGCLPNVQLPHLKCTFVEHFA